MIESLHFTYDGIKSTDMGIIQINVDSGLFDEHFLPESSIVEEKVPGRDKPYFIRKEREPITLPFSILFENELTDEEARKIGRWLNQDYYKPLIFSTHPHKIFYAQYVGSARLLHNGCKQGYAKLEMRCDTSHPYSPVYTDSFDLSTNPTTGTMIKLTNNGDYDMFPIIEIEKVEDGDISIINTSDGGEEFELIGLTNGELITVDCEYEEIETDIPGVLRYENHNDVFLSLPRGINHLKVFGKCKLTFKYEYKLI
ncbi:phage tail domain-containing protein [uncultured Metabacillus sp.]|uniref:phage tail domain-containing protein n=1 Tax=uncultured Metabacillus sp. TaxID=2860135 RepID=UPI0026167177|nr:phage tail domain-containing protein [uncultured Metabacillus sp.]